MDMKLKIDNVGGKKICFYVCQKAIEDLTCRCSQLDMETKVNVEDQQHKKVINRKELQMS